MNHSKPPEDTPILEWSALEHIHHKRTRMWYILVGLFVTLCLYYSITTEAWTFTILIAVLSVVYWKMHAQEMKPKKMRMWRKGFALDNIYSEWGECEGYWILKCSDYYELHIEKRNGTAVKIQTGAVDPYQLHDLLPHLLNQLEDRRENILDTIIRICKL